MHLVQNITAEPFQRHILLLDDKEIILTLRFLPVVQIWVMGVEFEGKTQSGLKLSSSVLHLRAFNFPFDFTVFLTDNSGLDPFRLEDFSENRCQLFFVTPEEMASVRGAEVPL